MKKFKVTASYTVYCETEVEAATEQEAWDIARELDGGGFTPLRGWDGDWQISMVQELREAA